MPDPASPLAPAMKTIRPEEARDLARAVATRGWTAEDAGLLARCYGLIEAAARDGAWSIETRTLAGTNDAYWSPGFARVLAHLRYEGYRVVHHPNSGPDVYDSHATLDW